MDCGGFLHTCNVIECIFLFYEDELGVNFKKVIETVLNRSEDRS